MLMQAERKRIDAEWASIRKKEREEAIKRAKQQMRNEEPRVRNLHSQLLMSTVLKERDLQLEYKVKRMLAEKISEKEEILKMRQNHLKDIDRAKYEEEQTHKKRYDFADDLRAEIEKRAHERDSHGIVSI
jgi:hypothetical protein